MAEQMEEAFGTVEILLVPSNTSTAAPGIFRAGATDPNVARGGESYSTPFNRFGNTWQHVASPATGSGRVKD